MKPDNLQFCKVPIPANMPQCGVRRSVASCIDR